MRKGARKKNPDWKKQVAQWMDECAVTIPKPDFLKADFPEWVQSMSRELLGSLLPEAKFRVGSSWSPRELGGVLGHQLEALHRLSSMKPPATRRKGKKPDKRIVKRMQKQITRFLECYSKVVQRSVRLALEQSYGEATEFFTAFARGLSRTPAEGSIAPAERTTTRIYFVMLLHWRVVERMKRVHELQQWLCKFFREPHLVGDVKRIEKMCQRLGLRFGPRGRPRIDKRQAGL